MWLWRRVLISVNNERKEWWWFVEVANIMKEREREKMGQKKKVYLLREILKCFVKLQLQNILSRIKWFEFDPPIWHFSKKMFDKKLFWLGEVIQVTFWKPQNGLRRSPLFCGPRTGIRTGGCQVRHRWGPAVSTQSLKILEVLSLKNLCTTNYTSW